MCALDAPGLLADDTARPAPGRVVEERRVSQPRARGAAGSNLDTERLLAHLAGMWRIRAFEEQALQGLEDKLVLEIGTFEDGHLNHLQAKGLLWFEVLMSASYLGMATTLAERMEAQGRGDETLRTLIAGELG